MSGLDIWFLNVGHGDCAFITLPNGARILIDCGSGGDMTPYKLLKYYGITKDSSKAITIQGYNQKFGIDKLVVSHLHGDHLDDIENVHDKIGFYLLVGGYGKFIDKVSTDNIDYKKRGQAAAEKFKEIVKNRNGNGYVEAKDKVVSARPDCFLESKRFLEYEDGVDLNDISMLTYITYRGRKVLFTGDLTAAGVNKILRSNKGTAFKDFVKGTTILKVPHHGRENGCSQEMFDAFGGAPLLCVASDEVLNERNQGTSNIQWYTNRTSNEKLNINNSMVSRKVLTTRCDKDIHLNISENGEIAITTNCFKDHLESIAKVK